MVMEKAECSLTSHFRRQAIIQPDFHQQVMLGVLKALQYLHQNGISHGDIDPQNILVRRKDGAPENYIGAEDIRLCDFGLAHSISNPIGHYGGRKDGFMAPELVLKDHVHDHAKADMWSLGCTMVAMETGGFPLNWYEHYSEKHTRTEEFLAAVEDNVKTLRQTWLPADPGEAQMLEFDFLVNPLLQIDVGSRVSSTEALNHPWFQFKSYPPPIYVVSEEDLEELARLGVKRVRMPLYG
ncbi:Mitogen-activated protein kinase HOG1 (Fragment) [Seminavis robusta]|uniref:Mitogen-activated protein kinase HOG1 n=1 Tax=Seminavis robusta TaxID=568900 RepID=A0A9N8H6J0_9STRA